MKRTLLIDADILIFKSASAHEVEIQWNEDLWTLHAHFGPARAQLDGLVSELKEKLQADRVIMALSDYSQPNWRKAVLPTYKANRKDKRKPIVYRPLREYVLEQFETFCRPGLEGDDVLGILGTATHFKKEYGERIIVTIDKDLACVPGKHFNFNPNHLDRAVDWAIQIGSVDQVAADRWHMTQTLTGDTTDGYSGCPGVGKVGAEKLLAGLTTVEEMWPVVLKAYAKAGFGEEEALRQARVARICRAQDYDFKKREVRLWNPTK